MKQTFDRLAEPIRRCVRWRTQVFKIEGFVCKRFLPSPSPPPPPLSFFGSRFICRSVKTKNPLPRSFFAPKPNALATQAMKKKMEKWPRLAPNHGLTPTEKSQLLDSIDYKGDFCCRIWWSTLSWPVLAKRKMEMMANFAPKPWTNPFRKILTFRLF